MKLFKLPDLGEGLQEAEIVKWHVAVGDEVAVDQPLVSVETAKAVVDVPAPYAGKVARLFGNEHDIAQVGAPLIGFEGEGDDTGSVVGKVESGGKVMADAPLAATPLAHGIKATPAVRALARKLDIDLAMVTPTGADGLITTHDVERAARILAEAGPQELLRGVRRTMAQSMTLAHAEAASVMIVDDADIDAWRPGEKTTVRLIRAIVAACKVQPGLNAWFDSLALGRRILKNIDLGIAVDTPEGLLVPVLRHIEQRTPEDLETAVEKLIVDARARRVPPEDLRANTITLTNFGTIAGRYASPIIVPPTVAIIGAGRIRKEVVAVDDKPAVHRILPLSVAFDHRAATGGEAARFLGALIADLELPT
jgi:pyruvate dehydrogenase E2 component (dihydrolipoamide acetyltransferase)